MQTNPEVALVAVSVVFCPFGAFFAWLGKSFSRGFSLPWFVKMGVLIAGSGLTVVYFSAGGGEAVKACIAPVAWLVQGLVTLLAPEGQWAVQILRKVTAGIGAGDILFAGICCAGGMATLQALATWSFPKPEDSLKKNRQNGGKLDEFLLKRKEKQLQERLALAEEPASGDRIVRDLLAKFTSKLPKKTKQDGVLLGLDTKTMKEVYITPSELNKHVVLSGTTGSGKTTTILTFLEYALKNEQAVIVVDGKGRKAGLPADVKRLAEKYGREVQEVNSGETSQHYNPLAVGTPTELADKLMSMTVWTEDHYRLGAREFLQYLFRVFESRNITPTLEKVSDFCSMDALVALITQGQGQAQPQQSQGGLQVPSAAPSVPSELQKLIPKIQRIDEKAVNGLSSRLGDLQAGDLRFLFEPAPAEDTLELSKVIENKGVAVFSLDSTRYMSTAPLIGRLIINDIKTAISRHAEQDTGQRVMLIFDEFDVFATPEVVNIINKSRDAGFEALIAFQSLADLDQADPVLRKRIVQNCNTLIVHRQNEWHDAEEWAKNFGTKEGIAKTHQTQEDELGGMSGMGSMREVEEFHFHPSELKTLPVGVACVRKHTDKGTVWHQVKVRQVS